MDISIRVDDQQVRKALGAAQSQAPFAIALAVSNVTKDAQSAVQKGYEERFTLRQPAFIKREGAKITQFAKKADPTAILAVTEKAGFLTRFEDGDMKRPNAGKAIAIPVAVRRNKKDIIPKSQRPPALYASKAAGAGRVFSKAGKLLQRVGRGAATQLRVLYIWKSAVKLPALLKFKETTNKAVDQNWQRRALEAVDKALSYLK